MSAIFDDGLGVEALKTKSYRARTDSCNCYVRALGEEALFTLRYGAHALSCPTYRQSLDPVDRTIDETFRRRHEAHRKGSV